MSKTVLAFDLDNTLAISKGPISDEMGALLSELLQHKQVCIISGGRYEQFKKQVIDRLEVEHHFLQNLHIIPTCGTRYYRYNDIDKDWTLLYSEDLSEEQKSRIISSLEKNARELGIWREETWGPIIEDRLSQVTYSALGQKAPPEEKYKWAEDNQELKTKFRDKVAEELDDFEVRLGGSTSIDITIPGVDKAYGMQKLMAELECGKDDILFVGDRLAENGNDYPVKAFGIDTIAVEKWEDTLLIIETINKLGAKSDE